MNAALTWMMVGPLFLVGFAVVFSSRFHHRKPHREMHDAGGHVSVVGPHPFDWREE